MERRFDVLDFDGNFFAKGKVSCRVLNVDGDFCLNGGELFCQELHVKGNVFIKGNVNFRYEGSTVPTSCKVDVGGDFFCEGTMAAHGGEMSIGGHFIDTSMVNLRYTRVKAMGNIEAEYLYVGEITSGGDININNMLDAKGRVYALGDINAFEITTYYNNVYCGGRLLANRYSVGDVFENVTDWKNLN